MEIKNRKCEGKEIYKSVIDEEDRKYLEGLTIIKDRLCNIFML
jgi:hypothetical protein